MLSLGHSFPRVRTAWFDFSFTYENIVIDEHDHFEFHTRNIVQNAFYKMKHVGERIGSFTFNGQRRLLQRTKKLSRRFGMNYGDAKGLADCQKQPHSR